MYSWEIDNFLRLRDWKVSTEDYLFITDLRFHPQLNRIIYNPFYDNYYVSTNDGWEWIIQIKK